MYDFMKCGIILKSVYYTIRNEYTSRLFSKTLTPTLTPLSQTMPSIAFDVSEDILDATTRMAQDPMTSQGDPYAVARHSAIASGSQAPASSADRPSASRQLTLHQVLARAQTPHLTYRTTARMTVRSPSSPVHFPTHSLLSSSSVATSSRRRSRSPTLPLSGSLSQRRRLLDSDSDEDDDPSMEAEDEDVDPLEMDEIPEQDAQPIASPDHSEAPDSPIPDLEPDMPDQPLGFEMPLSPGSDIPSEVDSEEADRGEIGRIWDRLVEHNARLGQLADRLEGVSADRLVELRRDMGTAVARFLSIRECMMDLHEQLRSSQRDIVTASEADRTLWRKVTTLEEEVATLRRERDSSCVEMSAMRREIQGLREDMMSKRQRRG